MEVQTHEIERLQNLLAEHERNMKDVTGQFTQLQNDHKEALTTVERLKSQIKATRPASPGTPGMLRRMASQSGGGVDRGQRSVTSLRTLMAEEFESKPDRMETAEVHLSAANTELQARLERIQAPGGRCQEHQEGDGNQVNNYFRPDERKNQHKSWIPCRSEYGVSAPRSNHPERDGVEVDA